jgi:hypothetical protein
MAAPPEANPFSPNRASAHPKKETLMSDRSRESKLAELRAKTDDDLANVIHRELAVGMELASANDFDSADHASAEQAYAIALKFLTTLADPAAVAALHRKSTQLRKAIDERLLRQPRLSSAHPEFSAVYLTSALAAKRTDRD